MASVMAMRAGSSAVRTGVLSLRPSPGGVALDRKLSSGALSSASGTLMGRFRTGYEHVWPRRLHRLHDGIDPEQRTFWPRHAWHARSPRSRRGFPTGSTSSSRGSGLVSGREQVRPRRAQVPQVFLLLSHRT